MENPARVCGITRRASLRRIFGWLILAPLAARLTAEPVQIKRQPVDSSVLASAGYDSAKRLLEIEFHSGAIYRYLEVPEEIYRRLLAAESKGHFFGAAVRDKFRSERVKARTAK
jgi:hypothetical protein